ncbi:MAG TPA: CPXCG motif-containing cysteine-rich protein [Candidatus Paceibacterota bacterium]|nr:CPXCG motif-containing cysteine-rich protein [Candidatus Paceibacterota bacterium]
MQGEIEHIFDCPYCDSEVSMLLDLSAGSQAYVEDCEACCNPIDVSYGVEEGALSRFEAKAADES